MNIDTWVKTKKPVFERDNYTCLMCLGLAHDVHHRKPRGMGGTSDKARNFGFENLISLCRDCHDHVHANPQESYESGYLVHSWDDPAAVPVFVTPDLTVWLRKDGTREDLLQQMLF